MAKVIKDLIREYRESGPVRQMAYLANVIASTIIGSVIAAIIIRLYISEPCNSCSLILITIGFIASYAINHVIICSYIDKDE